MLLVGYFEEIESERGICWRCPDSLSLRAFLGGTLTETVPDQSTLSRTRKRLPLDVFEKVFGIVLGIVADAGLLKGKVVGVDATYLRADASMKAILHREKGERYADYIRRLAKEDGVADPTVEDARHRLVGRQVSRAPDLVRQFGGTRASCDGHIGNQKRARTPASSGTATPTSHVACRMSQMVENFRAVAARR